LEITLQGKKLRKKKVAFIKVNDAIKERRSQEDGGSSIGNMKVRVRRIKIRKQRESKMGEAVRGVPLSFGEISHATL
jgi:hypothetical protein